MNILGFEITRTKAIPATLSGIDNRGGWWPIIRESFPGAWQNNVEVELANVLTYAPIYACITLIASDISKLGLELVEETKDGSDIWVPTQSSAFSPVLRKPNRYQTKIKFIEQWLVAKLIHGNAYILKQRDNRQIVRALYVLDSTRVRPLVAPDGEVFYQLDTDNLSGLNEPVIVPASEIIHDVMVPLYHPLCGVSPITACGVAAVMALRIQNNSTAFFGNGSQPGGVLTAPGPISQATADRAKAHWDSSFTGENAGKVAVLGDGLHYERMSINATDAQLVEQLNWTAEDVCTAFRVPPYKINVGPPPNYNNIEALDVQYYSQCLQSLIENIEALLDEGLGLAPEKIDGVRMGTMFRLDDLMRMDSKTLIESEDRAKNIKTPNESRRRLNLLPVVGGDVVYRQQQDFSLAALNARDESLNENGGFPPTPDFNPTDNVGPNRAEQQAAKPEDNTEDEATKALLVALQKDLELQYAS